MSRYPFSSYPRGWFKVAFSSEIANGQVKSLHYFGQDLVCFRDEQGVAYVLDAHCPHLGAHLGVGGKVVGNQIRCPFHGWQFDGSGTCKKIPYSNRIPPMAKIRAWSVQETGGIIFAYYDPLKREPQFTLPDIPEYKNKAWTSYYKLQWKVRGHIEEIAENAVDYSHFVELHTYTEMPKVEVFETNRHNFRVLLMSRRTCLGVNLPTSSDIVYHGLGLVLSPCSAGNWNILAVLTPTPIDNEHIEINLSILFKKSKNPIKNWLFAHFLMPDIKKEFERDIPIWENKVYRTKPLLCVDDGPIMKLRKWAKQFYDADETVIKMSTAA